MKLKLSRSGTIAIAVVAAIIGGMFGLFAIMIRSDFTQRGCRSIPAEEWVYTANCTDAYRVGMLAVGVACAGLAVVGWTLWRLKHV